MHEEQKINPKHMEIRGVLRIAGLDGLKVQARGQAVLDAVDDFQLCRKLASIRG